MPVPTSPGWKHPQHGHCEVAPGPAEPASSYKAVSAKASGRAKAFTAHRDLQCDVSQGSVFTELKPREQYRGSDQLVLFRIKVQISTDDQPDFALDGPWQKCLYHLFELKKKKSTGNL